MTRKEGAAISNLAWVTAIALTLASALGMLLTPAMLDEPWWLALILAHLALAVGAIAVGLRRWWDQKRAEVPVPGTDRAARRGSWRCAIGDRAARRSCCSTAWAVRESPGGGPPSRWRISFG
jgi:uncharacterized membrane protein